MIAKVLLLLSGLLAFAAAGGHIGGGYGGHQPQYYQPHPYRFGYIIKDPHAGRSFRHEVEDGTGVKRGSYGYQDPWGLFRIVDYVADHHGFRAAVRTNEPGTGNSNPAHVNINSVAGHGYGQGYSGLAHKRSAAPVVFVGPAPKVNSGHKLVPIGGFVQAPAYHG